MKSRFSFIRFVVRVSLVLAMFLGVVAHLNKEDATAAFYISWAVLLLILDLASKDRELP